MNDGRGQSGTTIAVGVARMGDNVRSKGFKVIMTSLEETVNTDALNISAKRTAGEPWMVRLLKFFSSVRLGVTLLVLLGLACFIGMLIMQQSVDGFARYFAELTPAQRLVYGRLGLFDIYHSWYFNALLAVLSLNIILASIDRFPKTWKYVSKPIVTPPVRWLADQKQNASLRFEGTKAEIAERVSAAMKASGWKKIRVAEKNGRTFVFGESGVWNRLGAYAVHVGLLTIFTGGFLTAQMGSTGQLPLSPGLATDLMFETVVQLDQASEITKRLPFEVYCTDMKQTLIKKDGSISAMNTIDWRTDFQLKDETGVHDASVQMNKPFDYRGYRFFQASFTSVGRARNITVNAVPDTGGPAVEVTIPRDGNTTLPDGTLVAFKEFRGDFSVGPEDPNQNTTDYPNPGAILEVTPTGGQTVKAYAFGPQMANMPVAKKPVAGYTFQLADFEKVADQHILSVQRDPGATVVYIGFILLFITLVAVFFFSHQRVWAAIEETEGTRANVILAGNTNRSMNAFDERFRAFVKSFGITTTGKSS